MIKQTLKSALLVFTLITTPVWANQSASEKVNINTADAETLDKNLKYVGEKTAKKIVEYRKEHGKFESVDDMTQVRGVGKKIIKANRNNMTVE